MRAQAAELEHATRLASDAFATEAEHGFTWTKVLDAEAAANSLLKEEAEEARNCQQQAAKRAAKKARQKNANR